MDSLLHSMQLTELRDAMVGDGERHRGISGGELRRLTIAVEIIALPRLIFMDGERNLVVCS